MTSNGLENPLFDQKTKDAIKQTGLDLTGGNGLQKKRLRLKKTLIST